MGVIVAETLLLRQKLRECELCDWKLVWRHEGETPNFAFDMKIKVVEVWGESYIIAREALSEAIRGIQLENVRAFSAPMTKLLEDAFPPMSRRQKP